MNILDKKNKIQITQFSVFMKEY